MPAPRGAELPDKVWLPWVQEGPYLIRRQHLVARDEGQVTLSAVPVGQQRRGLAKATLLELRRLLPPPQYDAACRMAKKLVEGRPYRLIERDVARARGNVDLTRQGIMALCRAGLVLVYFRNRKRASPAWEIRHVELSNWGRAVLISLDAVIIPGLRGRPDGAPPSLRRPAASRHESRGGALASTLRANGHLKDAAVMHTLAPGPAGEDVRGDSDEAYGPYYGGDPVEHPDPPDPEEADDE